MLEHELASIDTFFPGILVNVPDVPEPLIRHQLLLVLQDFCEHSCYWREPLADVFTIDGITSYFLEGPGNTDIVKVLEVKDAQGTDLTLRSGPLSGEQWWWQSQPGVLEVSTNIGGQFLKVSAAVKPAVGATKVSRRIIIDYRTAIEQGTLARLYNMPKKPWSEPHLYQLAQGQYISQRDQAARKAGRGFSTQPRRSQPKPRNFY
ncbi:hypothetical protein [Microbulbifer sp. GL-2]|uniref:hypothetical protein n=1 Tax=Microbulbifer sp. GL-2 TaxID=2591606 RepID=UPI0011652BDB|nr:hypothetical protein [Microbulbifer sp. GL-2]BBM03775.1 hypothetical protein GL2_38490 [Microbulbifer sp. GL-2]